MKTLKLTIVFLALLGFVLFAMAAGISYYNTITPNGIVIHHSATMPNRILKPDDLQAISNNHHSRGFSTFYWGKIYDIGYHYIILPDGTIVKGRPEKCKGAHTTGYNSYIGICLIGNFTEQGSDQNQEADNHPTPEQINSLISITKILRKNYQIKTENIVPHNSVNSKTECPGINFPVNSFLKKIEETYN